MESKQMQRSVIALLCLFLMFVPAIILAGQACSDDVPASTPGESFMIELDGTVLGKTTGLIWMRCSLGQRWNGQNCNGQGDLLSWAQALKAADSNQFGGYKDWRLPNKNELESIVELSCSTPAINEKQFPQTPSGFFWTSSPYTGVADGAWSIDFAYGAVVASEKPGKNYVRLVRDR